MRAIEICKNSLAVLVVREGPDLQLLICLDGSDPVTATFPTDHTLLAGVTEGYSYQVVAPQGSLTMARDGNQVDIRFDADGGAKTCRINLSAYEVAIRNAAAL